ncbi:unnamed protein product [Cylindrotheca closterium]|uniref:SET domain-containing protein n=1 Tax=Cylindrotheca closterium TaxID=2856 RepID=A0AAD2D1A5_9STRA|nr:unnamed protein product [Cylindrotheca closterium]
MTGQKVLSLILVTTVLSVHSVLEASAFLPQQYRTIYTSDDVTSSALFMAKAAKKKKKKPSGGGGLKGFGSPVSKDSSGAMSNIELDRSVDALAFYDFLESNDAGDNLKRCGLGFFPLENGMKLRGVVALKTIKKGDVIIRIPYELAANLGQEGADPTIPAQAFLKDYCDVLGDSPGEGDMARKSYYKMLPPYRGDDCLGSTDFFSDETLEALQSPTIVEETLKRRDLTKLRFERDIESEDSPDFPTWIDGTPVTVDHLQWAVWLITSRVLTVQGAESDNKSYRLLIPFLDMCNHDRSSPHILTGRAAPGRELKVVAGATVKEGEQINICYGGGQAGNDRFLQDYGFLDTGVDGKAYTMVAQQLLGKRRMVEGVSAGKLLSKADQDRTLDSLRSTAIEADKKLLEDTDDPALKTSINYRLGVKQALSKFIVLQ